MVKMKDEEGLFKQQGHISIHRTPTHLSCIYSDNNDKKKDEGVFN